MVRIRLRRIGSKKKPSYRIVVVDSKASGKGAYLQMIGHYDPLSEPPAIRVDQEEASRWLQRGAQPSERVAHLLAKVGVSPS